MVGYSPWGRKELDIPSSVYPFAIHGHTDLLTIRVEISFSVHVLRRGWLLVQRFILI